MLKELFTEAIQPHEKIIFRVCRIYCRTDEDRQDLFQDIMLQLWKAYPQFRNESKISTWMYRIAINTAVTKRKKDDRKPAIDPVAAELPEVAPAPEEDLQYERMMNAVEKLSQVEKAIVMLYLDDHSYREMSEVLGISESNIGFKLNQIKNKLRKVTENDHGA